MNIVAKKLIFFILLVSCKGNYAKLNSVNGSFFLEIPSIGVSDVKVSDWDVGLIDRVNISKGISVAFKPPSIREKDIYLLNRRFGVDSLIIEVERSVSMGQSGQRLVIPLFGKSGVSKIKEAWFNIYYSAVAISPRFENLKCPPFGHNFRITDLDTIRVNTDGIKNMMINTGNKISGKVEAASLRPVVLNFGRKLTGNYKMKMALFSRKKMLLASNWVDFSDEISIRKEHIIKVPGCSNMSRIPAVERRSNKIEYFKTR